VLHHNLIGQRLIALFLLGWLLFNYPLLALFNDATPLFGIPLIYVYLFAAWALLIVLMAFIVEHKSPREDSTFDNISAPALKE
jgi:TRAP-type C4-dicarboxylate transport system permease small subunit